MKIKLNFRGTNEYDYEISVPGCYTVILNFVWTVSKNIRNNENNFYRLSDYEKRLINFYTRMLKYESKNKNIY